MSHYQSLSKQECENQSSSKQECENQPASKFDSTKENELKQIANIIMEINQQMREYYKMCNTQALTEKKYLGSILFEKCENESKLDSIRNYLFMESINGPDYEIKIGTFLEESRDQLLQVGRADRKHVVKIFQYAQDTVSQIKKIMIHREQIKQILLSDTLTSDDRVKKIIATLI